MLFIIGILNTSWYVMISIAVFFFTKKNAFIDL